MAEFFCYWQSELPVPEKHRAARNPFVRDTQRREQSRLRGLVIILLAFYFLVQPEANSEPILREIKQIRRVLVFYELGVSSPAVALIDRELRATLEESRFQIELYPEHLETTLFSDAADQQRIRESYIRKYQDRRPDLIIALGPSPLRFMVDSHERFFKDIPIVFGGTSEPQADSPLLDSGFTGCWEQFEPAKTLEAALRLQPDTKHAVVVGGVSSFDRHLESIFREQMHGYEPRLDITYLTDVDMPSLLERLKHLPADTVVLYSHIGIDAKGTRFVGASQALPMVADAANAPVFIPSDAELGRGGVGGYLHSFAKEGRIVGGIAVRILNGARPQDVPIVRGVNAYMFDWRALKRWGLREGNLPSGSMVLFRPPSFWHRTKWVWVGVFVILLCLCALRFYVRLRRAKESQLALSGMLITAQERERSRLASEIHDDFSQRLALMALELENAEEMINTSPDKAIQQVHNILNFASELGADLHTLSHRLHSSTLERLGLLPAVTALCKEFATQQGIEVNFLVNAVPRSVHPDVALCLFRIVQEGLRNVKKHSGAAKAQVRLEKVRDTLQLLVHDEGTGFDRRDLRNKEGLGIRSMEERARLLGGRFEIHSNPGQGTRIEASVPLHPKSEQVRAWTAS